MSMKYLHVNGPGHSICCKLYCEDIHKVNRIIMYGHGLAGHKDNKVAEHFAEKVINKHRNVGILTFDLPAHGDDVKHKLTLTDCDTYISLILDYIRNNMGIERIDGYATSFGGYLFLKYTKEHGMPFERMILRCPAVQMRKVVDFIIPDSEKELLQKGREAKVGFDRKINIDAGFLAELGSNDITEYDYMEWADRIILIHGTKDEVVPIEDTIAFSEENVIELYQVEGADHRFMNPLHLDEANHVIFDFLF